MGYIAETYKGPIEVPAAASTGGRYVDAKFGSASALYVQIQGTFVATYRIEGSIDGETWHDITGLFANTSTGSFIVAPISDAGLFVLYSAHPPDRVRIFCVSHTSGTPTGAYAFRAP